MVEIIIGMALLTVFVLSINSAIVSHYKIYDASSIENDIHAENLTIMERLSKLARESRGIVASHNFSGTLLTSSSSTAVFELPHLDLSGNIVANYYDYLGFLKSPTSTYFYEYTDAAGTGLRKDGSRLLSKFASKVIFGYNNSTPANSTEITFLLEITKTLRGQQKIFSNSTSIYFQNKQ